MALAKQQGQLYKRVIFTIGNKNWKQFAYINNLQIKFGSIFIEQFHNIALNIPSYLKAHAAFTYFIQLEMLTKQYSQVLQSKINYKANLIFKIE